jgi:hypothetical protein
MEKHIEVRCTDVDANLGDILTSRRSEINLVP